MTLELLDQQLIASIQDGLPLTGKPFAHIAKQLGLSEDYVLHRLQQLKDNGTIKRLGVIVRHRELGFKANAMVVWDIPDNNIAEIAQRIASFDCVTLCYQRPRRLPEWPYNLFSMIHGKDRASVLERLAELVEVLELQDIKHTPLFSTKRYKQRGARYIDPSIITTSTDQRVNGSNVPLSLISNHCHSESPLVSPALFSDKTIASDHRIKFTLALEKSPAYG